MRVDSSVRGGTAAVLPWVLVLTLTAAAAAQTAPHGWHARLSQRIGAVVTRMPAAAFSLGAEAVQVGTAYLLCRETLTSPLHRAALKSNRARHTAVTNLFSGRPARSIVNRVIREIGPLNDKAPSFPLAAAAMGVLRQRAEARKCDDFSPLWCGQNATGCKEIPAAELTRELTSLL